MLCVFFVFCSVILCSKARLWLLRICSSSNRISSHNAHTFYLGSLFPVFMKRVKCHSAWIKWDGSLVTPHWCYSCRKKNIRVIDPTLSRLPLSWMRRRIALWQKSTHSAAAVAKSKDHYSSACKRAHFMHARARTHSCARAHHKRTNLWICVSFIQNHLRWQNAFSLLYENYRFSQWIAFTRKMLKYGWLMMKNVITLYYVYIFFFVVHFLCQCHSF